MKKKCIVIGTLFFLVCVSGTYAEAEVPPELLTLIAIKALNYDRSLDERIIDEAVIAVVYSSDDETEERYAKNIYENMHALREKATIRKFPVNTWLCDVHKEDLLTEEHLIQRFKEEKVSVVFILNKNNSIRKKISAVTKTLGINSFCSDKDYLKDGIAFAIMLYDEKPKMYINIMATKEEGSDYGAKLLLLCEQVD